MLEGLTPPNRAASCKVKEVIDTLELKDQEILKAALIDPNWPHLTLTHSLNERGIAISESPIRKHRLGRCSC